MANRLLKRWYLKALVFRHHARQRDRQYGWLFPVLAPPMLMVALACVMMQSLVAHWGAVVEIENHGGVLHYTRPAVMGVLPDTLLVRVERVELAGQSVDDELLQAVTRLRGVNEVALSNTSVSPDALAAFQKQRPHVTIRH